MKYDVSTVYEIKGPPVIAHVCAAVTVPAGAVTAVKIEFASDEVRKLYSAATLAAATMDPAYTPVSSVVTSRDAPEPGPTADADAGHVTGEMARTASDAAPDPQPHGATSRFGVAGAPKRDSKESATAKYILFTPHLHRKFFEKNNIFPLEGLYAVADLSPQDGPPDEMPAYANVFVANFGEQAFTLPPGLRMGDVTFPQAYQSAYAKRAKSTDNFYTPPNVVPVQTAGHPEHPSSSGLCVQTEGVRGQGVGAGEGGRTKQNLGESKAR